MSNTAVNVSGGLSNGATMYVEGGTVVGNSAALNGGGIQNEGDDTAIVNTTIARNRSRAGAGAANVNGAMFIETGLSLVRMSPVAPAVAGLSIRRKSETLNCSSPAADFWAIRRC